MITAMSIREGDHAHPSSSTQAQDDIVHCVPQDRAEDRALRKRQLWCCRTLDAESSSSINFQHSGLKIAVNDPLQVNSGVCGFARARRGCWFHRAELNAAIRTSRVTTAAVLAAAPLAAPTPHGARSDGMDLENWRRWSTCSYAGILLLVVGEAAGASVYTSRRLHMISRGSCPPCRAYTVGGQDEGASGGLPGFGSSTRTTCASSIVLGRHRRSGTPSTPARRHRAPRNGELEGPIWHTHLVRVLHLPNPAAAPRAHQGESSCSTDTAGGERRSPPSTSRRAHDGDGAGPLCSTSTRCRVSPVMAEMREARHVLWCAHGVVWRDPHTGQPLGEGLLIQACGRSIRVSGPAGVPGVIAPPLRAAAPPLPKTHGCEERSHVDIGVFCSGSFAHWRTPAGPAAGRHVPSYLSPQAARGSCERYRSVYRRSTHAHWAHTTHRRPERGKKSPQLSPASNQ
ncbi:unnamed protein product [Trichogramma brassicae]|uniref:Uncharacterized protein n=1 Tax=Trichogramma brassicae TaxID=86971 RepID=A0A6H5HY58_9HYME|nr:unnamed protein product [Trichogramma brassicae]